MKNEKIIITINKLSERKLYEMLGITKFAYPLEGFCVGMPNTFSKEEIPKDGYLYTNRILDNRGIDEIKDVLNNLEIKGIIFDDLGIIPLIKDKKMEKILYLSHFNTNQKSIEIYLNYVDSVIVSSDITKEEIINITNNLKDKVTLFTLGYVPAMYSRRLLLDNYSKFYKIAKKNPLEIIENNKKFLIYENKYGTVFYHIPLFNGLELMDLDCQYYFINSAFLEYEDINNLLNNTYNKPYDKGFLYQETIYKLKDDEDEE